MRNYIILSLMVSCFLIITGCGGEGGLDLGPGGCVTAPVGSDITFTMVPINTTCPEFVRKFDTFTVQVMHEDGETPLSDVLLWFDYAWAVPHEPGFVQFYDGQTAKPAPMNVCTDVDGMYQLSVVYDCGGDTYTGDLSVRSGGAGAITTFSSGSSAPAP